MGKRERPPDTGPDQAWIVTFSDCMTLLLCFFVMLLSFSTFEKEKRTQVAGIFHSIGKELMFDRDYDIVRTRSPKDVKTKARKGSETQTPAPQEITPPVHRDPLPGDDAYKDQRVITIAAADLFQRRSSQLKSTGKERYLKLIGKFLKIMPCDILVSQGMSITPRAGDDIALARTLAVVSYFTQELGIDPKRFSLCATDSMQGGVFATGEGRIQITLFSGGVFKK